MVFDMKGVRDELISLGYSDIEFVLGKCDVDGHYLIVMLTSGEISRLCRPYRRLPLNECTRLLLYRTRDNDLGYKSTVLFFYMNAVGI